MNTFFFKIYLEQHIDYWKAYGLPHYDMDKARFFLELCQASKWDHYVEELMDIL